MEQINLSDEEEIESGLSRKRQYKRLINQSFKSFQKAISWKILSEMDNIRTFESDLYIKGEALLPKICQQFICTLANDTNLQTRKQWDPNIKTLQVLEIFETENGYMYYMKRQNTQGIQWTSKTKEWTVFVSHPHPDFECKEEFIPAEFCIWIKEMEKYTFLTLLYKKQSDKKLKPDSIYNRIKLMENTAKNLKLCHLIYDPWMCDICVKPVPAHELECRVCKKERFGRCKELSCYRVLERNEICDCLKKKKK
jgi:hypothetical protein